MQQQTPRMFGGYYQVGQVISTGPLLTIYTAYNRYSSDVVGLYVVELPPTIDEESAARLLQVFERRRQVNSPHVIHVYDWGVDGASVFIATDPPRGLTLRHVLDTENLEIERALDLPNGSAALFAEALADCFGGVDGLVAGADRVLGAAVATGRQSIKPEPSTAAPTSR